MIKLRYWPIKVMKVWMEIELRERPKFLVCILKRMVLRVPQIRSPTVEIMTFVENFVAANWKGWPYRSKDALLIWIVIKFPIEVGELRKMS